MRSMNPFVPVKRPRPGYLQRWNVPAIGFWVGKYMVKPVGSFSQRIVFTLCIIIIVAGICLPVSADETNAGSGAASAAGVHSCGFSLFGYCLYGGGSLNSGSTTPSSGAQKHGLMTFTKDQRTEVLNEYNLLPKFSVQNASGFRTMVTPPASMSLLSDVPYVPIDRDQGMCGNCYVWATTGALEVEHYLKYGISDRLSIQYFDDSIGTGPQGEDSACGGGSDAGVAKWYNSNTYMVPWSNDNAYWGDSQVNKGGPTDPGILEMSASPSYKVNGISVYSITTYGVDQSTAISNIKSVLNSNHAVMMWFYMSGYAPAGYPPEDWDRFNDYFYNQPATAVWDPAPTNGDSSDGGHFVLVVGYDDTDPDNAYWIVLNSWGAPSNRPDGTYRLKMDMNYSAVNLDGKQQYGFDYIHDVNFAGTNAPVVGGVSDAGFSNNIDMVSITGIGFTGATEVHFGTKKAQSFTVTSDSTISAAAPSDGSGTVDVTVTTPEGTSGKTSSDKYTYGGGVPEITGVSPDNGPGGTQVTITGTDFQGGYWGDEDTPEDAPAYSALYFGTTEVPNKDWKVTSSSQIIAQAPPGADGTVDVTYSVYTSMGDVYGTTATSKADRFTYPHVSPPVITGINPSTGSAGGGTNVTITGTDLTGATAVSFGGTPATGVEVVQTCSMPMLDGICLTGSTPAVVASSPAGTAGTADVIVTTIGGTSAKTPADEFIYNAIPAVTGVYPDSGPAGTIVTVTGFGFDQTSTVSVGGTPATNVEFVPTCIGSLCFDALNATVPAESWITKYLQNGLADVTVTTTGRGTSATSTSDIFSYGSPRTPVPESTIPAGSSRFTSSISVTSFPDGAAIGLDGADTGQVTPYTFENVNTGNHIVTAFLNGYKTASKDVAVTFGSTVTADFPFVQRPKFNTSVQYAPGVKVNNIGNIINSGQATPSPIATIDTHEPVVHINNEYTPVITTAPVKLGVTPAVNVNIQHTNLLDTGSLTVTSTPSGAEIWINGGDSGQVTPSTFTEGAGSYQVVVKMKCYNTQDTQTVTVSPGETATADFSLAYQADCNVVTIAPVTVIRHVTV